MRQDTKHVLVAGGAGFIGSHITRALVRQGVKVSVLTRHASSLERLADLGDKIKVIRSSFETLSASLQRAEPIDVFISTAVCYGRRGESVSELIETNVLLPLRVIELLIPHALSTAIIADTFYPPERDAYARSKHELRGWLRMISSQHGIEVHNMILQHVYGPADGPHKFFPTVLRALTTNQPTLELTEGEQTRDFVYVEDVAEAFMVAALKAPTHSGSYVEYQIGTGLPSTLRTAVEIMHQLTRSSTQLRFGVLPYPPGEIMYSVADLEAVGSLPWVARTTLVDGIKRTVDSMSVTPPEAA